MKKILTVVGARPQFVKSAMVSKAFREYEDIQEIVVHTGQHYDANLSQIFFDELAMSPPHYQLGIGSGSQGQQTGEMLMAIEKVLLAEKPDILLIYGDTNSTLAGALAAAKCHVPISHVEAGLRSYNRYMPEEINRLVADQLSSVLFTPTQQAVINLKQEGYPDSRIIQVGDVMFDAALFYSNLAMKKSQILKKLKIKKNDYILVTIHRAENTDHLSRLKTIFTALNHLSQSHDIVLPLHPRTQKLLEQHFPHLLEKTMIQFIEPVGFLDMVMLEKNAALIMTDSGGVQKEAFFYQIPCITLRTETEWIETVELGWNTLVSPDDMQSIHDKALQKWNTQGKTGHEPFGHGQASQLIAQALKESVCVFG